MPIVTVQEAAGRSADQRREVIAAITRAFVEAYGIPPASVTVFFQAFSDDEWGKAGTLHAQRQQDGGLTVG